MIEVQPLSGAQYVLEDESYTARIASIGASLRSLQYHDRDLIVPYRADEVRPSFRGSILAPWPNRVVDGRYTWLDRTQQLPLTEPARQHALHGLAAWADFQPVDISRNEVTLHARIPPQQGYPHRLEITIRYLVDGSGLHATLAASNTGPDPAPVGLSAHPYLQAPGPLDEWILFLPARRVLTATPDRLIPVAVELVQGGDARYDFRAPRVIGRTKIDHAFTDLQSDADGRTRVALTDIHGIGAAMTFGLECPWVQIHTADLPHSPSQTRLGLAVEPMTCPPDAYNSRIDLIALQPRTTTTIDWTLAAIE